MRVQLGLASVHWFCSCPGAAVRLVGGSSCEGILELNHQGDWKPVMASHLTLKRAADICRELDCGSVLSLENHASTQRDVWSIRFCQPGLDLALCTTKGVSNGQIRLSCSGKPPHQAHVLTRTWSRILHKTFVLN